MRRITLSILLSFVAFSFIYAQPNPEKIQSRKLHKQLFQSQPELRSTIAAFFGSKPDSCIVKGKDGKAIEKTVFQFESNKETLDNYELNEAETQLLPDSREEYFFDKKGNDSIFIQSDFENGKWEAWKKTVFSYNESGALIYEIGYSIENGEWVASDSTKIEPVMNPGTPSTVASETYFSFENGEWVKSYQYNYTYDTSGRELSNSYSDWNDDENRWIPVSRETSEYGDNGKLKYYYDENWNDETKVWYPDEEKFIFNYASNGNLATKDAYEVNETTGTWDMSAWTYQETFYYQGHPAGSPQIVTAPNVNIHSTGGNLYIESESGLSSVSVYNISGSLMYTEQLNGNRSFTYSAQGTPGTYIVKVKAINGKSVAKKVVLK